VLQIKDKDGRTVYTLSDEDEEPKPVTIDDLILSDDKGIKVSKENKYVS
jgi:hypothetical protein